MARAAAGSGDTFEFTFRGIAPIKRAACGLGHLFGWNDVVKGIFKSHLF